MSSAYQVKIVSVEKFTDNVGTKSERNTAIVLAPSLDLLVWVGPQQVTEKT